MSERKKETSIIIKLNRKKFDRDERKSNNVYNAVLDTRLTAQKKQNKTKQNKKQSKITGENK